MMELHTTLSKADEDFLINEKNLDNVFIKSTTTKKLIPLSNLVSNNLEATSKSLKRVNRLPSVTLSSSITPGSSLGNTLNDLISESSKVLPASAKISFVALQKNILKQDINLN